MEYFLPAVIAISLVSYIIFHLPGLVCISIAAMAYEGYLTYLDAKELKAEEIYEKRIKDLEQKMDGILLSKGF